MAIARDCNSLDFGLRQFESDHPQTYRATLYRNSTRTMMGAYLFASTFNLQPSNSVRAKRFPVLSEGTSDRTFDLPRKCSPEGGHSSVTKQAVVSPSPLRARRGLCVSPTGEAGPSGGLRPPRRLTPRANNGQLKISTYSMNQLD